MVKEDLKKKNLNVDFLRYQITIASQHNIVLITVENFLSTTFAHNKVHYAAFILQQQKLDSCFHRLFENWALPLTLNVFVNSSSISIINVSFGILMTSRLQICPCTLKSMKK